MLLFPFLHFCVILWVEEFFKFMLVNGVDDVLSLRLIAALLKLSFLLKFLSILATVSILFRTLLALSVFVSLFDFVWIMDLIPIRPEWNKLLQNLKLIDIYQKLVNSLLLWPTGVFVFGIESHSGMWGVLDFIRVLKFDKLLESNPGTFAWSINL